MIKRLTAKIRNLFTSKKTDEINEVRPLPRPHKGQKAAIKGTAPATEKRQDKKRENKRRFRNTKRSGAAPAQPQPFRKTVPSRPETLIDIPAEAGKTRFSDFNIHRDILFGIQDLGFKYCTPIQEKSLPTLLDGKDLTGKTQTGTGKTAAFLIAIINHILNNPRECAAGSCRAIIMAPTRELAVQIHKDAEGLCKYTPLNNLAIFGGMDHRLQREKLQNPIDILIGTPGRIIDYTGTRHLDLSTTEILVIDEADRMLDMGFIPDVRRIVARLPRPEKRQTMLFSATFDSTIMRLVENWMVNPVSFETETEHVVTELIDQQFYTVSGREKLAFLVWLINHEPFERMLIFGNRKSTNFRLAQQLKAYGIKCGMLSGDVPQIQRMKILEKFRSGDEKIVIATDVAARGIHVDGISHVVNYDLPERPEDYVHRIGRTGRAGETGKAISFVCEYGAYVLGEIEEYTGSKANCILPEDEKLQIEPLPNNIRFEKSNSARSGGRRFSRQGTRGYQK